MADPKGVVRPASLGVIILAGGRGRRMCSDVPKVCHILAGQPLLQYVVQACREGLALNHHMIVVASPDLAHYAFFRDHPVLGALPLAIQPQARGTAHAVMCGLRGLPQSVTHVMVLCGDVPTVSCRLLSDLCQHTDYAAVWVGFRVEDPSAPYGRIIQSADHKLLRIVEWKNATDEERKVSVANSGVYLFSKDLLLDWLPHERNVTDEWYLTDLMARAAHLGQKMHLIMVDATEAQGVNTRVDLARAHHILQERWRKEHMEAGVTMINPHSIMLSPDVRLERDVTIEGPVQLGIGVHIHERATIRSFSCLEHCTVRSDAVVGPFAHIRGGSILGDHSVVGNFVEVKGSCVGSYSKMKHLSYIGDTYMGRCVNVGAGAITCNYDGSCKHRTTIRDGAHIGANVSLVAPVTVGAQSYIGAGSVITQNIEDHTLALERSAQIHKPRQKK